MDEITAKQHITVEMCKRSEDKNLGFVSETIDLNDTENIIDKPVLLCFGGNRTKDIKTANGTAKVVGGLLGKINELYDIYSISYGDEYMMNREVNAEFLCNKLFMPLVSDNGQRLSLDEAMKRMRRVNIFTHCAGSSRVCDVMGELKQSMAGLGYSKSEKDSIMGQVLAVNYAPWAFINDFNMKKIYIQSIEDTISPRVVEQLYLLQTKNTERKENLQLSHKELETSNKEGYKTFLLRTYRLLMDEKIASFSSFDKNKVCYISKGQSIDYENLDHDLKYMARNDAFKLSDKSSSVANSVSLIISESLLLGLSQSIINERSKKAERLYSIQQIKDMCDSVVKRTKGDNRPDDDFLRLFK